MYTLALDAINKDDFQICGGKGANLGELTAIGARVPPGFCITADALGYLLRTNALEDPIAELAAGLDFEDLNALEAATAGIRDLIAAAHIPADLESEIGDRYRALVSDANRYVAVRSSVAVKDTSPPPRLKR
jgi:pyruvate,water dikinase